MTSGRELDSRIIFRELSKAGTPAVTHIVLTHISKYYDPMKSSYSLYQPVLGPLRYYSYKQLAPGVVLDRI